MTGDIQNIVIPDKIQQSWQEIVDLMAELFDVPAGLIMRLNQPVIEVFSTSLGNPYHVGDSEHFDNSGLYCERVIKTGEKLHVPNALEDEEWKDNPDVKLNMISYLGFPLLYPDKSPFGTICILDSKRNEFSQTIERLMLKFKGIIESNLELIYMNKVLGDENRAFFDYIEEMRTLRRIVPICSNCRSIKDSKGQWKSLDHFLINNPDTEFSHGLCPDCISKLYPEFSGDLKKGE